MVEPSKLTHFVMCKWPSSESWDTIAGFDCESAAVAYQQECQARCRAAHDGQDFLRYTVEKDGA
jgi:hypothetical protein